MKPALLSHVASLGLFVMFTGQVEEVRVLVEFVEDCARGILEVGTGEDSDRVGRELVGELLAALPVLKGGDVRGDYVTDQQLTVRGRNGRSHFPRASAGEGESRALAARS